jgi:hypothetical protein
MSRGEQVFPVSDSGHTISRNRTSGSIFGIPLKRPEGQFWATFAQSHSLVPAVPSANNPDPLVSSKGYVLKNGVVWDVTPCGSCKNRRFGGTERLHRQGDTNR